MCALWILCSSFQKGCHSDVACLVIFVRCFKTHYSHIRYCSITDFKDFSFTGFCCCVVSAIKSVLCKTGFSCNFHSSAPLKRRCCSLASWHTQQYTVCIAVLFYAFSRRRNFVSKQQRQKSFHPTLSLIKACLF